MLTGSFDDWKHRFRRRDLQRAAAILLLCCIGTVWNWRTAVQSARTQQRWGSTAEVLVATTEISAGDAIDSGNSELRRWPAEMIPADYLTEPPKKAVARQHIGEGQGFAASDVVIDGDALYPLARRGTLAVTLPNADERLQASTGDHVELVIGTGRAIAGDKPTDPESIAGTVVAKGEETLTIAVAADDARSVADATLSNKVAVLYDPVPDG